MTAIKNRLETLKYWEENLLPDEIEALHDNGHTDQWKPLSANEVFGTIVNWEGGIATAYQIKAIISRVYGVELGA